MVAGSLLTYGGKRYLWIGLIAGISLLLSYYYYYSARQLPPSGSTPIGLAYGWIGFIAL